VVPEMLHTVRVKLKHAANCDLRFSRRWSF